MSAFTMLRLVVEFLVRGEVVAASIITTSESERSDNIRYQRIRLQRELNLPSSEQVLVHVVRQRPLNPGEGMVNDFRILEVVELTSGNMSEAIRQRLALEEQARQATKLAHKKEVGGGHVKGSSPGKGSKPFTNPEKAAKKARKAAQRKS